MHEVRSRGEETIFALSTARGLGAIAVVRLSGPGAGDVLAALCGGVPEARRAALREIRHPESGESLDRAIVLWFPGPKSATGEDVGELHLHGGHAVVAAIEAVLGSMAGLRLAEPGEFTRRGFLNGVLDLTAAEGLGDLIAAETEAQRRQALGQYEGGLGRLYGTWREALIGALAQMEAAIDFVDEEVPEGILDQAREAGRDVETAIARHLDDGGASARVRDGVKVAIVGAPNVGKSSLMNHLAGRDVAIVHEQAGTTRDAIEVHLNLRGYAVDVVDTAGLRETRDPVESEGVRRAREAAAQADIVMRVMDVRCGTVDDDGVREEIVVVNKIDLKDGNTGDRSFGKDASYVSCLSGAGLDELVDRLSALVVDRVSKSQTSVGPTRQRHRGELESCLGCLGRFAGASEVEIGAEELRGAVSAMGRITGHVGVEDVLDRIFKSFCIGK